MTDAAKRFHEDWLGMVQPTEGLVVSIPALIEAEAFERQNVDAHRKFAELLEEGPDGRPRLEATRPFLTEYLAWADDELHHGDDLPEGLSLYVPEGPQTIRPTAAFLIPQWARSEAPAAPNPAVEAGRDYRLLVLELPAATEGGDLDLDKPEIATGDWDYPASKKLERLLRECRVPIGVLMSRSVVRLIYAPHGEAAGHIDFRVADMADVGGRPILDALVLLLGRDRLVNVAPDRQLHAILKRSREMQAEVTTALSDQVFFALETLLRGFEAADARAGGEWLRPVMEHEGDRDHLFDALLTVLLRLVFLLYAEDAGLLPTENSRFQKFYSLYALYERLEADRTRFPDAMNRRYSAWPGLLALFRVIYLGASHGDLELPPREGHLFDPNRFPFLEGFDVDAPAVPVRAADATERAAADVPTIDDETIYLILRSLIFLEGSRLSYRSLQVEQIGSVYEGLMGWATLRIAASSVRLKPSSSKDAPLWVSVEELFDVKASQRAKWLKSQAGVKGARGKNLAKDLAALEKEHDGAELLDAAIERLEEDAVKDSAVAMPGRVVLQPGEERKRTSSHYTPPELSGPIVARALEPLLACFGETPKSEQILSLKICDPAMGSGAFLVEACRYLGERLVEAWAREDVTSTAFGADDDLTTYARRQIAERCLYGVDKNPVAVELAKLSLWLVTLQKDKPFTFLDHALRCGDSLVGCSLDQITEFHWDPSKVKKKKRAKGEQLDLFDRELEVSLHEALQARERIAEQSRLDTAEANRDMRLAMKDAEDALSRLRLIGDLLIGAFFSEKKDKARETERKRRKGLIEQWLLDVNAIGPPDELLAMADEARRELRPFHWMLEFPEVFWAGRVDPLTGSAAEDPAYLDGVIGNPPFAGKNVIAHSNAAGYLDYLMARYPEVKGRPNTDLCAYFFRRAAEVLGEHGVIGLIATNTIAQGDSRLLSLKWLVDSGARIYDARPNFRWPGDAAVSASTVHVALGRAVNDASCAVLKNTPVDFINSRLRPTPERAEAKSLVHNGNLSFLGGKLVGIGLAITRDESAELRAASTRNHEVIRPYIGGRDVNSSPDGSASRDVIDFTGKSLDECKENWPELLRIVEERVKPSRMRDKRGTYKTYWWRPGESGVALYKALEGVERCLVTANTSKHLMFSWQPVSPFFSNSLYVFALSAWTAFAVLQSRIHERWARLLSSSMKNDLRYAASDCFETFPFPYSDPRVELPSVMRIGETVYDCRASLMAELGVGLTGVYNLLKDSSQSSDGGNGRVVERLRELHVQLDRTVLEAYATSTGDSAWADVEVPPFADPVSSADVELHQQFEDHVLDKLFELNAMRAAE